MTKQKFDGLVEAVRYTPEGDVDWVRAYERRGPTFSDVILIQREELVKRIKAGKKFVTGQRKVYYASEFELSGTVHLAEKGGKTVLVVNEGSSNRDHLDGVSVV